MTEKTHTITETLTVERLDELDAMFVAQGKNKDGFQLQVGETRFTADTAALVLALAREGLAGRAEIERLRVTNEGLREIQMQAEAELAAARTEIIREDASHTRTVTERDGLQNMVNDIYRAAVGQEPQWSNHFGLNDAMDEIRDVLTDSKRADAAEARIVVLNQELDCAETESESWAHDFELMEVRAKTAEARVRVVDAGLKELLKIANRIPESPLASAIFSLSYSLLTPPTEPAPVGKDSLRSAEPGADTL